MAVEILDVRVSHKMLERRATRTKGNRWQHLSRHDPNRTAPKPKTETKGKRKKRRQKNQIIIKTKQKQNKKAKTKTKEKKSGRESSRDLCVC